jgi:hypothetical protein
MSLQKQSPAMKAQNATPDRSVVFFSGTADCCITSYQVELSCCLMTTKC